MAASTAPLIWDFYRTIDAGPAELGGVVHYYDEASQSLYLDAGLVTRLADIPEGHWEDAAPAAQQTITETAYDALRLDHPVNGILYGAAIDDGTLAYLRYVYAKDLTEILESGSYTVQVDNQITQMTADIKNIGADIFAGDNTLFNPGGKLSLSITMGDSAPYPIGIAYLDDVTYCERDAVVPLSGRNTTGYLLAEQTFDETTSITGYADEVVIAILTLAGITKYHIGSSTHTMTHTFSPSMTLLAGLQQVLDFYGWKMLELPDGAICIGYDYFLADYQTNSVYTFDGGAEVKRRKTGKSADAAYSHAYVTGKDAAGADLTPVYLAVDHFDFWGIGAHKTMHITAPAGFTQSELADYAARVAEELQYVGIGEEFDSQVRPYLLIGDVAAVYYAGDEEATSLGLITSIRHDFGKNGYATTFSVDSGGVYTEGEDYVIVSRSAILTGFNRRQRIVDLVQVVAKQTK